AMGGGRCSVGPNMMYVFHPFRPSIFPDNFIVGKKLRYIQISSGPHHGKQCELKLFRLKFHEAKENLDQPVIYVFPSFMSL
ncbi:hypothetical protein PJI17_30940, partial [Mycobacterium kansasii]